MELEARLTAGAADKKKPKVHSVQEAAARTVASTAGNDDDEISQWLAEENNGQSVAPPSDKPGAGQTVVSAIHDTVTGKTTDDTTTSMPADQSPPKKEKKSPVKVAGQFKRPAKPMAESSRSAAEDMLRQFFPGKKVSCWTTVRAVNQLPKSAALLGLAFDNEDGHTRLTRGKNFLLVGGCQETHAVMQETAVKINEQLDKRSMRLEDVSVGELRNICRDVVESIRPS